MKRHYFSLFLLALGLFLGVGVNGKFLDFEDLAATDEAKLDRYADKLAQNYFKVGVPMKPCGKKSDTESLDKCKKLLEEHAGSSKKNEDSLKKEQQPSKSTQKAQDDLKKEPHQPLKSTLPPPSPQKAKPLKDENPPSNTTKQPKEPENTTPIIKSVTPQSSPKSPVEAPKNNTTAFKEPPKPEEDIIINGEKTVGITQSTPQTKVPFSKGSLKDPKHIFSIKPTKDMNLNIQLFTLQPNYQPGMRLYDAGNGRPIGLEKEDENSRYFSLRANQRYFIEVGVDDKLKELLKPSQLTNSGKFIILITTNTDSPFKQLKRTKITGEDPKQAKEYTTYDFDAVKLGSQAFQRFRGRTNFHGTLNTQLPIQFDSQRNSLTFHWLGGKHNGCNGQLIRQSLAVVDSDSVVAHDSAVSTVDCTYNITIKHNCFKELIRELKSFLN